MIVDMKSIIRLFMNKKATAERWLSFLNPTCLEVITNANQPFQVI